MIASRLILHHNYEHGVAFDLSENRNHGTRISANAVPPYPTALKFDGGPSAVRVAPSPSLQNLRSVRAQVRFYWEPKVWGEKRHNLVEGHEAFALFMHPQGELRGTILNQLGDWEGATSAPGVVQPGEWHNAELLHDGLARTTLYLDGQVVAEGFSSPGPVQSVGPDGVAIGHWPSDSDQYTLEGYIAEVRVWCDDPVTDIGRLIDECCIDREAIDTMTDRMRAEGPNDTVLRMLASDLLDIGREGASWLARGSAAERTQTFELAQRFLMSYFTADHALMANTVQQGMGALQARAPATVISDLTTRLHAIFEAIPAAAPVLRGDRDAREQVSAWLAPWCLDKHLPPVSGRDPERPDRPPPAEDHSLSPHTDAPPHDDDPTEHEDVDDE
jgi:hypothetical protein